MATEELFGIERVPLLTAAEMTARDAAARDDGGIPERVLMENAGRAAALVLDRLYPRGRVLAAVGSGNNGGDALVMLRALRSWGREVAWLPVGSREPDATLLHGFELPRLQVEDAANAAARADVLVDGILGTGARGAPREPAASVIRTLNASGRPIVALDVPSGVDPTTADVPGVAVDAAATIMFGWPKRGLLFPPGRARAGRLVTVEIGFPPEARAPDPPGAALLTPGWAAARLPRRAADGHKGTFGRVLIAAGSEGMAGAAAIAGRGAIRAGAGLVSFASPAANRVILQAALPEAVFVEAEGAGLDDAAARSDAVVVGPGMGTDDEARARMDRVLERTAARPAVLDADALNLLEGRADVLARTARDRPVVITPHPGEFVRLTGREIEAIRARPVAAARELAEQTGCVVLLKGMPSVVAGADEPALVNTAGSSDLASAGMGDLLAGAIAAFLAAGADARTAAGVALHYTARAADIAAAGRSLTPTDVADHLSRAFALPGARTSSLGLPFVTFDQAPR